MCKDCIFDLAFAIWSGRLESYSGQLSNKKLELAFELLRQADLRYQIKRVFKRRK